MTLTVKMNELFSSAGLASQILWKVLVIKMDDTTSTLLWVFDNGFPVLSHSLLLMKGNLSEKNRGIREFKQPVQT